MDMMLANQQELSIAQQSAEHSLRKSCCMPSNFVIVSGEQMLTCNRRVHS